MGEEGKTDQVAQYRYELRREGGKQENIRWKLELLTDYLVYNLHIQFLFSLCTLRIVISLVYEF